MSLPNELVDHILSFLQSDLDNLKKCAQSHPILSKFAERYIYAKIRLYDNGRYAFGPKCLTLRTNEFAQVIARNPNITNHVHSLDLHVQTNVEHKAMTSYLNNVASMLPTFSRLKKITLNGGAVGLASHASWHTLPEVFCQAFQRLLHLQCLKDAIIYHISFLPLYLFNNCHKTLRMTLCECVDVQYDKGSIGGQPYQPLEHLTIKFCQPLDKITSLVQTCSLRSLRVKSEKSELVVLPQLLSSCSSTLINLDLDTSRFGMSSSNPTFSKLTIHCTV